MPNRTRVILIICLLLTTATKSLANDDPNSPEELVSRARLRQDIWVHGTPPMFMRAEIQALDNKGLLAKGDYRLDWISPVRWREQIEFPGYERIRVRDDKGYWEKSGVSYEPAGIYQLEKLLKFKDILNVSSKQLLGKLKDIQKDGVRQKCTEIKSRANTVRTLCFNEAKGLLTNVEYPTGAIAMQIEISRIEYGDFTAIAEKLVPFRVVALQGKKVIASETILEIGKIVGENPELFAAPVNAEFWAQCEDRQEAEIVNHIQPDYPSDARSRHEQGLLIIYAEIEVDGSLSHVTPVTKISQDLSARALEAVRQWRYKPATCGSVPIRVQTIIEVKFTVGP
jgi:hypothetical protein